MVIVSLVVSVLSVGSGAAEGSSEVTLCGFVEGPEGPVEGAIVEIRPVLDNYTRSRRLLHGQGRPAPVTTGAVGPDGRYCVDSPAPGVFRVVVKAPGFVPMRYFPLPLGDEALVELPPVRLLSDARTRVRITNPDGDSVPAAVYALPGETAPWKKLPPTGWNVASRLGWLETEGEMILPRAEDELLDLYVNPRGSDRLQRAREMEHARFVLPDDPGRSLRLEVVSGDRPVVDAVIGVGEIAWPVAMTDGDGRVTLAGLHRRLVPLVVLSKEGAVVRRTIDLRKLPADQTAEIHLPPARPIGGRVSDDRGEPLPEALVWIGSDPGRFVRTGPRGGFRLTVAGENRFWIQGHARGHLPGIEWIGPESASEASGPLVLKLDRAVAIQGRVADADGEPLPGTEVLVESAEDSADRTFRLDPRFARARSGPEGRFSVRGRDGASYTLTASRPGYRPARIRLAADRGERPEDVVLRLARYRSGWGRVLGPEGPLERVTVWLLPAGSRDRASLQARARRSELDPERSTATDEDGVFRVAHLPASSVDLVAYRPGFAPVVVPGIEARADEGPTDLGTVVLREGVELHGRIVDPEGAPVGTASVWVLDPGQRLRRGSPAPLADREPDGRSGTDGAFLVSDIAAGASVRLGVDAEGYRASVVDLAEVGAEEEPVEIVLERTGLLRGEVLDPEGSPVTGARVTVHPKGTDAGVVGPGLEMEPERTVRTDAEGIFELAELRPGRYGIDAYREGFLTSASRVVDVAPGAAVEGIGLRLRDGAIVEGWVLAESGRPVEGADVVFGRPAARTGPDGSFVVEAVKPGETTIEVRHPDYVWHQETRELDPGFNVIELRLEQGASVQGVTLSSDGEPLSGVNVRLSRQARPYREYSSRSRRDGSFRLDSVQPGTYRVGAGSEALVPVDPKRRIDVGSEGLEDVVLRLRSGATIRGSIQGLDLDELAQVRVLASNAERPSRRGRVDHSGAYTIGSVAPGVWWVKASLPDGTKEAEARVVVEEEATEVSQDLDLSSGLELRGVVLIEGEPSARVQVGLRGLDRSVSRGGRTDLRGRFEIGNLPEGRYRVTVSDPKTRLIHNELLRLFGDREITVSVESGSVRGTVISEATGEALKDVLVVLGQMEGTAGTEVSRVTVGTNGRGEFRITKLSAGRYRLAVRKDGYVPEVSTLEIGPGQTRDLQVELKPADGLRLRVRRSAGDVPRWAFVRLSDPRRGRLIEEIRPIEKGLLEIPTVPAGTWNAVLAAPESAPTELRVTVPGAPVDVTLAPAGKLRVQAPALEQSGREATVQILDPSGRPVSALDPVSGKLRSAWSWRRNGIVIEGIPAGQWLVRIEATDGATWSRTVTTRGGGEKRVVIR